MARIGWEGARDPRNPVDWRVIGGPSPLDSAPRTYIPSLVVFWADPIPVVVFAVEEPAHRLGASNRCNPIDKLYVVAMLIKVFSDYHIVYDSIPVPRSLGMAN